MADDTLSVIAELKHLRNLEYHDRPVSLCGGMRDLPLIVARPDGARFFEPEVRDPVTDGKLWVEFDAAAASLRETAASLTACSPAPGMAEEIEDLEAEAVRMDQQRYEASDRKYHGARAMANRDLKADYAQRVSRRRPRES